MSKRLTDPKFKYVPAAKTDLRKTFARIRRELKEQQRVATHATPTSQSDTGNVTRLRRTINGE